MQDPIEVAGNPGGKPLHVRLCPGAELVIKPNYFFPTNSTHTTEVISCIARDKRFQKKEILELHDYFLEREKDLIAACDDITVNNDFDAADVTAMKKEAAYFNTWAKRLLRECEGKLRE